MPSWVILGWHLFYLRIMLFFWVHWTVTDNIHWSSLQLSEIRSDWWIAQSRLGGRIQVEEFRYLGVSFMSNGKKGLKDRGTGCDNADFISDCSSKNTAEI